MPDNPIAHEDVINNTNNIFFISYEDYDGYTYYKTTTGVTAVSSLTNTGVEYLTSDNFFYLNGTKLTNGVANSYTSRYGVSGTTIYKSFIGRGFNTQNKFFFQYRHSAPRDQRIDPSISNIIELQVLTTTYYNNVLSWTANEKSAIDFPIEPTVEELNEMFASNLNSYKAIGDQLIYTPAKFKLLFGTTADSTLQSKFKVVKAIGATMTDNEIKARTIQAINTFFDISNWNFGESFYYTELCAYIHNQLSTQISSVVIVGSDAESKFGDLFEIVSGSNELFYSTATVDNIEIVNAYTDQNLKKGS